MTLQRSLLSHPVKPRYGNFTRQLNLKTGEPPTWDAKKTKSVGTLEPEK